LNRKNFQQESISKKYNKSIVFVYGTLKKGFSNHILLEKSMFLGSHTIPRNKGLVMYDNGFFPELTKATDKKMATKIVGELYLVDDDTLENLDCLESVGFMYDRAFMLDIKKKMGFYLYITKEKDFSTYYTLVKNGNYQDNYKKSKRK
jgi:gamma-glutamylcyclotransferase (GGCT)/AIG2-like uncharacterized protein YtfP